MSSILSSLRETPPPDTVKSVESNVATPAFDAVASSADISNVLLSILVLIPVPALTVKLSPSAIAWAVPLSANIVIVELDNLLLGIEPASLL